MSPAPPPALVFAHGNSFPAASYRVLLDGWRAAGYEVFAPEMFGHHADYPVTSNWPHLLRQFVDFVDHEVGRPAYCVGHSLGGFLSLKLTLRHPAKVRGLVMLDSPVLSGWRAQLVRTAKATGLISHVSPARVARRRRRSWPSLEAAYAHFRSKASFAAWDERALRAYIEGGMRATPGGVALAFDPGVEAAIYDTLPHHLADELRRWPPQVPLAFVGGTRSEELRMVGMAATRALVGERLSWVEGTHLFPFERPDDTIAAVLHWLRLSGPGASA